MKLIPFHTYIVEITGNNSSKTYKQNYNLLWFFTREGKLEKIRTGAGEGAGAMETWGNALSTSPDSAIGSPPRPPVCPRNNTSLPVLFLPLEPPPAPSLEVAKRGPPPAPSLFLAVGRNGEKTSGGEEVEDRNQDEARFLGSTATTRKVTKTRQAATAQAALLRWPCPFKHGTVALMAGYLVAASVPRKGCGETMTKLALLLDLWPDCDCT